MTTLIGKALLLASVLGMLSVPSCTQRQIGKGAAVVAVGTAIGAAVIIDDANRNDGTYDRYPRDRYRRPVQECRQVRRCNTYYDRWGNAVDQCRYVTECSQRRHRYFMALQEGGYDAISAALTDKSVSDVVGVVDFAEAHSLSFESAERFSSALDLAKEGDFSALEDLGLSEKDIESLAMLRFPSDESIKALSENLDQFEVMTKGMIGRMLVKAREYQAELEEK